MATADPTADADTGPDHPLTMEEKLAIWREKRRKELEDKAAGTGAGGGRRRASSGSSSRLRERAGSTGRRSGGGGGRGRGGGSLGGGGGAVRRPSSARSSGGGGGGLSRGGGSLGGGSVGSACSSHGSGPPGRQLRLLSEEKKSGSKVAVAAAGGSSRRHRPVSVPRAGRPKSCPMPIPSKVTFSSGEYLRLANAGAARRRQTTGRDENRAGDGKEEEGASGDRRRRHTYGSDRGGEGTVDHVVRRRPLSVVQRSDGVVDKTKTLKKSSRPKNPSAAHTNATTSKTMIKPSPEVGKPAATREGRTKETNVKVTTTAAASSPMDEENVDPRRACIPVESLRPSLTDSNTKATASKQDMQPSGSINKGSTAGPMTETRQSNPKPSLRSSPHGHPHLFEEVVGSGGFELSPLSSPESARLSPHPSPSSPLKLQPSSSSPVPSVDVIVEPAVLAARIDVDAVVTSGDETLPSKTDGGRKVGIDGGGEEPPLGGETKPTEGAADSVATRHGRRSKGQSGSTAAEAERTISVAGAAGQDGEGAREGKSSPDDEAASEDTAIAAETERKEYDLPPLPRRGLLYDDEDGMDRWDTTDVDAEDLRRDKRSKKKKKKDRRRRTTILFAPQSSSEGDDAGGDEAKSESGPLAASEEEVSAAAEAGREGSEGAEVTVTDHYTFDSSATSTGEFVDVGACHDDPAIDQTKTGSQSTSQDDIAFSLRDYERLATICRRYRDEHSAVSFLVGILRMEKHDLEERLRTLSEAYEEKMTQFRKMSTELSQLRVHKSNLERTKVETEANTEKMVAALQSQMMTGLSAAVERTKMLEKELEAAKKELAVLRGE